MCEIQEHGQVTCWSVRRKQVKPQLLHLAVSKPVVSRLSTELPGMLDLTHHPSPKASDSKCLLTWPVLQPHLEQLINHALSWCTGNLKQRSAYKFQNVKPTPPTPVYGLLNFKTLPIFLRETWDLFRLGHCFSSVSSWVNRTSEDTLRFVNLPERSIGTAVKIPGLNISPIMWLWACHLNSGLLCL